MPEFSNRFEVGRRTIARWQRFWREQFLRTPFWKVNADGRRGLLKPNIDTPASDVSDDPGDNGHALAKAGNASLMSHELMDTLVDHAAGNYRLLMTMGAELLAYGMVHEVEQLDEKFYLEVFQPARPRPASKKKVRA